MKLIIFSILVVFSTSAFAAFFTNKVEEKFLELNQQALIAAGEYSVGLILPKKCPATVVNEKYIITAAHCISTDGYWHRMDSMKFIFSSDQKTVRRYRIVGRNAKTTDPHKNWSYRLSSHNDDVVILEIEEPLSNYAKIKTYNEKFLTNKVTSLGFPQVPVSGSLVQKLMTDKNCEIKTNFHDSIYYHNCGAYHGTSGGPILVKDDSGQNFIIGIQLGVKSKYNLDNRIEYNEKSANYALMFDQSFSYTRNFFSPRNLSVKKRSDFEEYFAFKCKANNSMYFIGKFKGAKKLAFCSIEDSFSYKNCGSSEDDFTQTCLEEFSTKTKEYDLFFWHNDDNE